MRGQQKSEDNQQKENSVIDSVNSGIDVKSCPICLCLISSLALIDSCSHEFCYDCISQWSTNHNRCPICRQRYTNIKYNIISDEIFDETAVEEEPEVDEGDIQEILHRMLLYLRLIGLRNRSQRRRDQLSNDFNRIQEESKQTKDNNQLMVQQIKDMRTELRQLDEDINRFNETLSSENPSEDELREVLNSREDEINDIEVIDIIFQPNLLQINDFENEELFTEEVDEEYEEELETLSDESSGNESDDELEEEELEDQTKDRKRKNESNRQNPDSDDSEELPPKRRKHN